MTVLVVFVVRFFEVRRLRFFLVVFVVFVVFFDEETIFAEASGASTIEGSANPRVIAIISPRDLNDRMGLLREVFAEDSLMGLPQWLGTVLSSLGDGHVPEVCRRGAPLRIQMNF